MFLDNADYNFRGPHLAMRPGVLLDFVSVDFAYRGESDHEATSVVVDPNGLLLEHSEYLDLGYPAILSRVLTNKLI